MKEVIIKSKIVGKEGAIGGGKPIAFPDLSAYALKSDFIRLESSFNEFLEGDDTDNVINRWKELEAFLNNISEDYNLLSLLNGKADKATTLSGYGITDAYTKTNVDDLLKAYVTLSGSQTITGEKNFTGGLKVNGSPIVYDATKKYWKLEGDLLVTGGVTMYGNEGTFTPSTIMDAIAVDGTTISKSGGVLKVIGGTGGGVADSVAWANITGKPTWIGSSKPTYSYSEITGAISTTELQNYLTSNSYLNVTSGDNRYLKLSGGTLTDGLTISAGNLIVSGSDTITNSLYPTKDNQYTLGNSSRYWSDIYTKLINGGNPWTSANDGSGSGLDADLLDGLHNGELTALVLSKYSDTWNYSLGNPGLSVFSDWNNTQSLSGYFYGISIESVDNRFRTVLATPLWTDGLHWRRYSDGGWQEDWRCLIDSYNIGSYNAGSATKLQTARTIWGQSFDGTGNVDGLLSINGAGILYSNGSTTCYVGSDSIPNTYISGGNVNLRYGTNIGLILNSSGNVGIGTTNPSCKLDVNGSLKITDYIDVREPNTKNRVTAYVYSGIGRLYSYNDDTGYNDLYVGQNSTSAIVVKANGNVGIGTGSPAYKLDVSGDIATSQYLRVKAWSGYGSGICSMWYNGNTTQLVLDSGASLGYNLDVNGTISANSSNAMSLKLNSSKTDWGFAYNGIGIYHSNSQKGGFGWNSEPAGLSNVGFYFKNYVSGDCISLTNEGGIYLIGNVLASGGITMYSDKRKKTILNHVELSLKQIAEAPLIEHYYNSDEKRTTHVGSIAQYWASMNDWFCKLDNEGYYTMEIQNAALASAISVARELVKFENETDKRIRLLEEENKELRNEIERLKAS